jgi:DNA (cytosine-5)-methyltransferase 1
MGPVSTSNFWVDDNGIRCFTERELERLQGFPDNYTNTPTSSDTTRYKALGNSMAVPVMKWIGQRINELS